MSMYGLRNGKHGMISNFSVWSPSCLLNFPKKKEKSDCDSQYLFYLCISYDGASFQQVRGGRVELILPRGCRNAAQEGGLQHGARAGGPGRLRWQTAHGTGRCGWQSAGAQPGSTESFSQPSRRDCMQFDATQEPRFQLKGSWAGSKMGRKDLCHLQGHVSWGDISGQMPFILAQSYIIFNFQMLSALSSAQRKLVLEGEGTWQRFWGAIRGAAQITRYTAKGLIGSRPRTFSISSRFWHNILMKNCLKNQKTMHT